MNRNILRGKAEKAVGIAWYLKTSRRYWTEMFHPEQ